MPCMTGNISQSRLSNFNFRNIPKCNARCSYKHFVCFQMFPKMSFIFYRSIGCSKQTFSDVHLNAQASSQLTSDHIEIVVDGIVAELIVRLEENHFVFSVVHEHLTYDMPSFLSQIDYSTCADWPALFRQVQLTP